MADWKKNPIVGIVAGVILVIAIISVASTIAKRAKQMPKVEIDITQKTPGPGTMK